MPGPSASSNVHSRAGVSITPYTQGKQGSATSQSGTLSVAGEVGQCCWDSRAASLQPLSQALQSSSPSEARLRSSTVSSHRKETSSKEATRKLLAAQMLPSKTEAAMKNKVQFDNFILTLVVFERPLEGVGPVGNDWASHTVGQGLPDFWIVISSAHCR